jgi:hypothetical protein
MPDSTRDRVTAALRRDPVRANRLVGIESNADSSTVRLTRLDLEKDGQIPRYRATGGRPKATTSPVSDDALTLSLAEMRQLRSVILAATLPSAGVSHARRAQVAVQAIRMFAPKSPVQAEPPQSPAPPSRLAELAAARNSG